MVKVHRPLDDVFHALAHQSRREMLNRLGRRALTVGELAEPLDMSLAAASKHIKVLELAGLVHRRVEGRRHVCRLNPGPLASATAWIDRHRRYWDDRLDALNKLLGENRTLREDQ